MPGTRALRTPFLHFASFSSDSNCLCFSEKWRQCRRKCPWKSQESAWIKWKVKNKVRVKRVLSSLKILEVYIKLTLSYFLKSLEKKFLQLQPDSTLLNLHFSSQTILMKSISIFPYPECSDSVQYNYRMSSSQIDQVTCPLRPFQWLILVLAISQLVQDTSGYKIMEQKFMVNSESSSPFHHMRILMSFTGREKGHQQMSYRC